VQDLVSAGRRPPLVDVVAPLSVVVAPAVVVVASADVDVVGLHVVVVASSPSRPHPAMAMATAIATQETRRPIIFAYYPQRRGPHPKRPTRW
jgi:hypothetical protein